VLADHLYPINEAKKTPKSGTYKKKKRARKIAAASRRRNW